MRPIFSEAQIEKLITRLEELMAAAPKDLSPSDLNAVLSETIQVLANRSELERELNSYRLLAAGISDLVHRLTNPAGAIRAWVLQFEVEEPDLVASNASLRDVLERVQTSATQITQMLRGLRRDLQAYELRPVDVNTAIREALSVQPMTETIDLTVDLDENLPSVRANGQLSRVFANLVSNAVEAMEGSGRLEIGTALRDNYVEAWVSDSGPGIPPQDRELIFDPNFTTKAEPGPTSGMGLWWTRNYVEACGGQVSVESTLGEGTRMVVTLPTVQDPNDLAR